MKPILFALGCLAVGCGGESETACAGASCADAGPPGPCTVQFAGNYEGSVTTTTPCASLAKDKAGWTLSMMVGSESVGTTIQIALGEAPTAGEFSSETVATWSAVGIGSGKCAAGSAGCQPLCEYSAGNASAPQGSFVLALSSLDLDASAPVAHGALEVTQDVHAGAAVDCGPGDAEQIAVDF